MIDYEILADSQYYVKQAIEADNISAKELKACASAISNLVNATFVLCELPIGIKGGQLKPLHKKKDPLDKINYRLVSTLPITSKIYERSLHDQLSAFMDEQFNLFLLHSVKVLDASQPCTDWTLA